MAYLKNFEKKNCNDLSQGLPFHSTRVLLHRKKRMVDLTHVTHVTSAIFRVTMSKTLQCICIDNCKEIHGYNSL